MASISTEPSGRRSIQFVASDGKRRPIRLGKISQRLAAEIKVKVEALNAAKVSGLSIDNETASWVARLGDELADKLAGVGLIQPRASARLGAFCTSYIDGRTDIKPRTRINLLACRTRLVEYFGEDKPLREITPGTPTPGPSGSRAGTLQGRAEGRSSERSSSSQPPGDPGSSPRIPSRA